MGEQGAGEQGAGGRGAGGGGGGGGGEQGEEEEGGQGRRGGRGVKYPILPSPKTQDLLIHATSIPPP